MPAKKLTTAPLEALFDNATKPTPAVVPSVVKRSRKPAAKKAPKAPKAPVVDTPVAEEPDMPLPAGVEEPVLAPETKQTREEWLLKMTREHFVDLFAKNGAVLPEKIRMSCGWPSSRAMQSKKGRVLGQCWRPEMSSDGHFEIFITPALGDGVDVAGVLAHELVHACMPKDEGHGRKFRELAMGIGLEGKMTATVVGEWLKGWLERAITEVGPYPHAKLDMSQQKKQTTRLLKVVCVNVDCDFLAEEEKPYTVRMSARVFEAGKPCCGVCQDRMEVAEDSKTAPKKAKQEECPDCGELMDDRGCKQCSFFAARDEERAHGDD